MDSEEIEVKRPPALLIELESKMQTALRRGLEATREIASILLRIRDEELWHYVSDSFSEYLTERTPYARASALRLIDAELVCRNIEKAKPSLQLPQNDSQALELRSLDEKRQPVVWRRILDTSAQQQVNITAQRIRDAVEQENASAQQKAQKAKGVQIDMDDDLDELYLTEKGEEALARITALCGKAVAIAIRQKRNEKITEDAVRKWADANDDAVREVPRYVIDNTWTVRKALNYISQVIEDDTTVDQLLMMARERKGRFAGSYQDARITVEIIKA